MSRGLIKQDSQQYLTVNENTEFILPLFIDLDSQRGSVGLCKTVLYRFHTIKRHS